jgi:hypothetical protein
VIDACCDRAVALARSRGRATVGGRLVLKALAELGAIDLPRLRTRPPAPVAAMLAATIAVGAIAAASLQQPKLASRAHPAPPAEPFSAFRVATLDRAWRLSDKPDVRGLLTLQAEVRETAGRTANSDPAAVDALLFELDRLIEGARERQLAIDRELILQHATQR